MSVKAQLLEALNLEKNGDWDSAHRIVQNLEDKNAHWIHAYLHRVEGDLGNSGYWYARAGKTMPNYSYEQEWQELYDHMRKF